MFGKISNLNKILDKRTLDSSDFILIALDIIRNEKETLEDKTEINTLINAIKTDYFDVNYERAVEKLIQAAQLLSNQGLVKLFTKASLNAVKNNVPEQVESRRYFETRFAIEQWKTLDTEQHHDSLDRLAKFMVGANLLYAEKKDFSKLRKVKNISDMEMVIVAVRDFGEQTNSVLKVVAVLRNDEISLARYKDRGKKRDEVDVGATRSPGVIKANTPVPCDELRNTTITGSVADSFLIDRSIKNGYSAGSVNVPYVNSVSGTAYVMVAILENYILTNSKSPSLQQDLDHIIQTFISFTCKSGYHSLSEMFDVLYSDEVSNMFDKHNLKVNYHYSKETLDTAQNTASDYVKTRQYNKIALEELSNHTLFKRVNPGPIHAVYSSKLSLLLRNNKQTGPGVARALDQMYQNDLEKNKPFTPEKCKEIAQQYLNYAKIKHPNANVKEVKEFIHKMDGAIKEYREKIEDHIAHLVEYPKCV